ncbi:MAG: hypothetical protein A2010_05315 [Nitrospirae bacterium GWD2_57_9]|nr:MAG: hypothetical protein A2010_05315 [Nitrospirae bacterium GWD2_57_9]OGW51192.1 MAG: hypothetical protein A2078_13475 [Nitrospirae bacterium GWC2_57_9]
MKKLVSGITLVVILLAANGAYAWWGGYGPGYGASVNVESMKKFQKETLNLRDDLVTREVDLQNEYAKAAPDANRIAVLRKEIIDLEAKIQTVAEKHGLPAAGYMDGPGRGRGMMGRGTMAGGPGSCGCARCGW